MILANVRGEHKVAAVEFVAVRDTGRKMHWLYMRTVSPAISHVAAMPGRVRKDQHGQFRPIAQQEDRPCRPSVHAVRPRALSTIYR